MIERQFWWELNYIYMNRVSLRKIRLLIFVLFLAEEGYRGWDSEEAARRGQGGGLVQRASWAVK